MEAFNFLNFWQLGERWKLDEHRLKSLIIEKCISPYFPEDAKGGFTGKFISYKEFYQGVPNLSIRWVLNDVCNWKNGIDQTFFSMADISVIEKDHPELNSHDTLSAKDSRELGRLRSEQNNADDALKAAVVAGLYAAQRNTRLLKAELWDELEKQGFGKIPERAFREIWKTIPQKFRSTGGRPKKKTMTS